MEEFSWIYNENCFIYTKETGKVLILKLLDNKTSKTYTIRCYENKTEALLPVELQNKRFIEWVINYSPDFKKYLPRRFLDNKIIVNDYLVKSYVNGEDILDYEIDDLEDNYEFMIKVMKYTKDKNMFELCSEDVKNTYEVVVFILNNFSNDIDFVMDVVSNYLDNERDKVKYLEVLIRVCNLYGYDNNVCLEYSNQLNREYKTFNTNINYIKDYLTEGNSYLIENGFYFVLEMYKDNKIIANYFASRFISEYFTNIDLEIEVHKSFETYNELEVFGINKYLIKLLNNYDTKLADYVISNIYLLDMVREDVDKMKDNWYNAKSFYKRVLTFYPNR